LFFFNLWESRWRMVTARDTARGAPGRCPRCDHAVDIYAGERHYAVCGLEEEGLLDPTH